MDRIKEFIQRLRLTDLLMPLLMALAAGIKVYNNISTDLHKASNGIVSLATYEGVDIGARVKRFYLSGLAILLLFFLFVFLYHHIIKRLSLRKRDLAYINTLTFLSLIITTGSALVSPEWSAIAKVSTAITVITIVWLATIRKLNASFTPSWDRICLALIFAFSGYALVMDAAHLLKMQPPYGAIYALIPGIYIASAAAMSRMNDKAWGKTLNAAIAVAFIPALYMLSNELYMLLHKRGMLDASMPLVYISLLCLVLAAAVWRYKRSTTDSKRAINWIGAGVVFSLVCCVFYKTTLPELMHNEFETANQANAAMNLFRFHKLPLLDFYTSHLFTDQVPAMLYFGAYDYNKSFDYIVFNFIFQLISYTGIYVLMLKVFNRPWHALFYIALLPFLAPIQFPYVFATCLFCYYFFSRFTRGANWKSFLLLSLILVLTALWRVDVAVSVLPAIIAVLALWALAARRQKTLLKYSAGAILFWIAITGAMLLLLANKIVWNNFSDALAYIGASQAHGLPEIFNAPAYLINVHFFILPILVITAMLLAVFFYLKKRIRLSEMLIIVFFAVIYIFNFNRGIVRHTITAGEQEYYLSSFLYFIIPFSFIVFLRVRKYRLWVFSLCSLIFILAFKYPDQGEGQVFADTSLDIIRNRQFFTANDVQALRVPVYIELKAKYADMETFMDKNFGKDATMLDMSNTPMMYYYLQRPVPGYFCQYMQNMVTAPIQEHALLWLQKYDVPIAVFSSYPAHPFFDQTDGVMNTLRYHKIANYIYNNYHPLGVISGKYVWLKNNVMLKFNNSSLLPDSVIYKPEQYSVNNQSYLWEEDRKTKQENGLQLSANGKDSWSLRSVPDKINSNYLVVSIENNTGAQQLLKLNYNMNGMLLGAFTFTVPAGVTSGQYLIPVSTQYNWHAMGANNISITKPANEQLIIRSVSLYNGL